ncbi:Lipoyltransferase 1, mitochondrial [Maudiozyma exigua]|uniref:Putative lipoate-protein ligase A n=1 Tax=Maudiozyma exigua TaxID=34358 RepID=A0A9P7BD45_MAUEX|nr:Lipoyltransferase 1, mitochondrial [Kazachstania exigua]
MFKLCRSSKYINKTWRSPLRYVSTKTPFDIDESDDKYKDFNTMYSEMFTPPDERTTTRKDHLSDVSGTSESDDLNKDLQDLFQVDHTPLSGSELQDRVKSTGRFVIRSLSHNPYYNLALEDYLFRNAPVSKEVTNKIYPNHRLLFYINNKCAVIGKNQIIWQELYLPELKRQGYEVLRRLSGGGTVIHDLGNVNYSFITSRNEFHSNFFNELVVKWLLSYDNTLPVTMNKRSDILYDDKKCSGSAFKIAQGKAYHHGTMLVKSQLSKFHGLLKPKDIPGIHWDSASVDSVRSNISNIPLPSTDEFINICSDGFQNDFRGGNTSEIPIYYCDETNSVNDEIVTTMNTLNSDKWRYFSGPKFKVEFKEKNISISCEKGVITDSSIAGLIGKDFKTTLEDKDFFSNKIYNKQF